MYLCLYLYYLYMYVPSGPPGARNVNWCRCTTCKHPAHWSSKVRSGNNNEDLSVLGRLLQSSPSLSQHRRVFWFQHIIHTYVHRVQCIVASSGFNIYIHPVQCIYTYVYMCVCTYTRPTCCLHFEYHLETVELALWIALTVLDYFPYMQSILCTVYM